MSKKNVSAIVSGAGWIGGLADGLIKTLRERGVSDEAIHSLVTEGGQLPIGKIADALAEVIGWARNFCLKVGQRKTTEEAVMAGKYDWANNSINSHNFPMRLRTAGERRVIEPIEFGYDPTSEEVLAEAKKRGLERPVYEDTFDFGEQFPEEQRKRPIVFLHEPWQDPDGLRRVLVLDSYSSERGLYLYCFDYRWPRHYIFAFVRK